MRTQSQKFRRARTGLVLLLLGWACAGTPVTVDLPSDHPASPQAAEAPFVPPPNPFAEVLSGAAPAPEMDVHEGHEGHTVPEAAESAGETRHGMDHDSHQAPPPSAPPPTDGEGEAGDGRRQDPGDSP